MEDPTNTYSTGKHRPQVPAKHSPHPHPQACRDPDSPAREAETRKQQQKAAAEGRTGREREGGRERR